jgi:hypothetical protein
MKGRSPIRTDTACAALFLITLATSCNRVPQPSPAPGPGTTRVTTLRLEVSTPEVIAPGAGSKLGATAIKSDGSREDVTDRTKWRSGDERVLRVTPEGVATGLEPGEASVFATYESPDGTRYAGARLTVLVPGTFRISGWMTDSGAPIPQATVTVISGVGEGLSTSTLADGSFNLYGVAGRVRLQAKREGYLNHIEELDVTASILHIFSMTPDRERLNVAGAYTLTIGMGACDRGTSPLPAELRQRRYNAAITQQDSRLTVTLSGADFVVTASHGNRFTGTIDPLGRVTFMVGDPADDYLTGPMDLVERLNQQDAFVVYGVVAAQATATTIAGTMQGYLMVSDANDPTYFRASGACSSSGHTIELRR